MPKVTQDMWDEVLLHWERVFLFPEERIGPRHCNFCQAFASSSSLAADCKECPVYEQTGIQYCEETPYYNVSCHRKPYDVEAFLEFRYLVWLYQEWKRTNAAPKIGESS